MAPLGLFSPHFGRTSTLCSVEMFTTVEDITMWCARYGSHGCYLEQRQSNPELVISHQFLQEDNGNGFFYQFYPQTGNNCEMSVLSEEFWGNIPLRHCVLVVAEKIQFHWTKLANLQNIKGHTTDKSRWHQDHWMHFLCWHWSSELEYAQAWRKHYELSSPSLDLEVLCLWPWAQVLNYSSSPQKACDVWALQDVFEAGEFQLSVLLQLFREADEVLSASACYLKMSDMLHFLVNVRYSNHWTAALRCWAVEALCPNICVTSALLLFWTLTCVLR